MRERRRAKLGRLFIPGVYGGPGESLLMSTLLVGGREADADVRRGRGVAGVAALHRQTFVIRTLLLVQAPVVGT